jgi:predicted sulfurtransferase
MGFMVNGEASVFETSVRLVGGLLSAHRGCDATCLGPRSYANALIEDLRASLSAANVRVSTATNDARAASK